MEMRAKFSLLVALLCAVVFVSAGSAYAAGASVDKIHFKDKVDKETTSELQATFAGVNVISLPTSGKKPVPTLAGETVTFTIGSASFQGTADSRGKLTKPFSAALKGTTLSLNYKGLPLIALFPLATSPDGKGKTVVVHFLVTAGKAGQATVVLVDKTVTLTYDAEKGNVSGKNTTPVPSTTSPTVIATNPVNAATGVALNQKVTATFNGAMDSSTINTTTMTLMQGSTSVAGTVAYASGVAIFTTSSNFVPNTVYTATISTGAKDLAGNALASNVVWSFTSDTIADPTAPIVVSTQPVNSTTGVAINTIITATFSKAMDPSTLTAANFTVTGSSASLIAGSIVYDSINNIARFTPSNNLDSNTTFTVTISTGVKDLAGNALAVNYIWSFTTNATASKGPAPVSLGMAGNYVILAKAGIDTVPSSNVTGDLGVSPAAATFITGFTLVADPSNVFSTSAQVTGKVYAANYAVPTPGNLTTAVSNMETAYTDAAGRTTPDFTELGAGDISGLTLVPGLYKWGTSVSINTNVTLNGGPNDVWIFQVGQGITQANGTRITLTGGALPKNIFWQSFGVVAIGTTAHFEGVILSQTSITLNTGATINGRLLAQTAVTLKSSTVTQPAP